MKHHVSILRLLALLAMSPVALLAVNEPIIFEAENATQGVQPTPAIFQTLTDGATGTVFVRVSGDFVAGVTENPGTPSRVLTFSNITFPAAGTYDLYVRLRVGAGNADDDSFYYGTGFGIKPVTTADTSANNSWVKCNGINAVGFNVLSDIVAGPGAAGINVWKWVRLSQSTGTAGEGSLQFTVPAGALTQTLQIGSRENGLDFDKIAFAPSALFYKVSNLDNGEPGTSVPPPPPYVPPGPPIATGQSKYLGDAYSTAQSTNFAAYWNQVTPENGGKWGSVEAVRNTMVWTELDTAYALAKSKGFPFKFHTLIWGNQQPAWIESLPPAEQLAEIEQWFAAVAARYPAIDQIEVVNEPLHDPPSSPGNGGGNYINALGGAGATGWDWVLNAFRLARLYFPNSQLILNDYSIVNDGNATQTYLHIIDLLQDEDLIDAIGEQGHAFSTTGSTATMKANLDLLATTGLPIYITELDIDGPTDDIQLAAYQRIFPTFWEHPAVQGITLWGFRPGHWRTAQGAYITLANGAERPAMKWLLAYVPDHAPVVTAGQAFSVSESTVNGAIVGSVLATDVDAGAIIKDWQITGGTGAALFSLNAASGQLSVVDSSTFDFESSTSYTLTVKVGDGLKTSAVETITVNLTNANDNAPVITPPPTFVLGAAASNIVGPVQATDLDNTNQPGFTTFNWQITGGTGAAVFAIDSSTGTIRISNPSGIDFTRTSYTLVLSVGDGVNTSAPQTVTVSIPTNVRVTYQGRVVVVYKLSVPALLRAGATVGG